MIGPPPFLDSPDPRSMRRPGPGPGPPSGELEPPSKVPRIGESFRMVDDRRPPMRQSFGDQAPPPRQSLDNYTLGPRRDDRGNYMETPREPFTRDSFIERTRDSFEAPRDPYAPRDLYPRSAAPTDRSLFNERSSTGGGVYNSPAYDRYTPSQPPRDRDLYAAPRDPYAALSSRSAEDTFSRAPQRDTFRNGRGSPPSIRGGFEPTRRSFEPPPTSYADSPRDPFVQEPKAGIRGTERWSGDPYSGKEA